MARATGQRAAAGVGSAGCAEADDLHELCLGQRTEHDDLVHPVEELGRNFSRSWRRTASAARSKASARFGRLARWVVA